MDRDKSKKYIYGEEICYVWDAVKNIDPNYHKIISKRLNGDDYTQAAENAFTAELYYQLKTRQENFADIKELNWHFDLNKKSLNDKRPDLVLHTKPKDYSDQRIFIEIKTSFQTDIPAIKRDLDKLFSAVTHRNDIINIYGKTADHKIESFRGLDFKIGVYIFGNTKKDTLLNTITEHYKEVLDLNSSNQNMNTKLDSLLSSLHLIYFLSDKYKTSLEYKRFSDIING